MGRKSIPWTFEQRKRLTQMWNLGRLIPAIADELGVSATAVKKMRAKLNLPSRQVARMKLGHEINVRFTEKQWLRLEQLSETGGMTKARLIRLAIERFTGFRDDE